MADVPKLVEALSSLTLLEATELAEILKEEVDRRRYLARSSTLA